MGEAAVEVGVQVLPHAGLLIIIVENIGAVWHNMNVLTCHQNSFIHNRNLLFNKNPFERRAIPLPCIIVNNGTNWQID